MKYRTIIELICEASDKEDAYNIAGEYLRGHVDFGVEMRCNTAKLWEHKAAKYALSCLFAIILFSALVINVTPLGGDEKVRASSPMGMSDNFTVTPPLKTKHKADFRKEWETKKEEVILKYLKK